jgi:hypothetical protein
VCPPRTEGEDYYRTEEIMGEDEKDGMAFAKRVLAFIKEQLAGDDTVLKLIDKYLGSTEDDTIASRAIADIMLTVESALGTNPSALDVAKAIAKVFAEVMEIAESFSGIKGAEKKELVQGLIWGLYSFVDRGVDGTKNRIDIPWVPANLEVKIERKAVYLISGFAIESIVALWNRERDELTEAADDKVDAGAETEEIEVPGIPE